MITVVSYWNSTSNHNRADYRIVWAGVVSYWNSTSNHNIGAKKRMQRQVVSYWNSTSNHNYWFGWVSVAKLYLIEILHQTTTYSAVKFYQQKLYLIEILHQTTTIWMPLRCTLGCILLKFYIKPQLCSPWLFWEKSCILLKFYIKPQQRVRHSLGHSCCILLKFYIKPQPPGCRYGVNWVVSYWNSTSNHNFL